MAFFKTVYNSIEGAAKKVVDVVEDATDKVGDKLVKAKDKISDTLVEAASDPENMMFNAVRRMCAFNNDTEYNISVVRHDGTFELAPDDEISQWIFRGFAIDLIIKFPNGHTDQIEFSSSQYQNRLHKISEIFHEQIDSYERKKNSISGQGSDENDDDPENMSDWSVLSDRPITKLSDPLSGTRHLKMLRHILWDLRAEWANLLIELDMDTGTRDAIEAKHGQSVEKCFTAMLEEWLSRSQPPPTWQAALEAVNSPTIARANLAEKIETFLKQRGVRV